VAFGVMGSGRRFLEYPVDLAGLLMLLIETAATCPSHDPHRAVHRRTPGGRAMSSGLMFALGGLGLLVIGGWALVLRAHLIRKVLAINIMGAAPP
jgi:hypothetical protein